jgi:AcrR family transcriptional regulator
VDAAAELVAEHGLAALTMRALAQRCGVSTMSLYRHVSDKDDLLASLADRAFSQIALPAPPGTVSWQEELTAMFRSIYDVCVAKPEVVSIGVKQPVPGEASYRGVEVILDILRRAGFEGEAAASAFATLQSFTLGFVHQQLFLSSGDQFQRRKSVLNRLPVEDIENLSRLGPVFLQRHSERHFDDGLDTIIRGLASKAKKWREPIDSEVKVHRNLSATRAQAPVASTPKRRRV